MKTSGGIADKRSHTRRNRQHGCLELGEWRDDLKPRRSIQGSYNSLSTYLYVYLCMKKELWKSRHSQSLRYLTGNSISNNYPSRKISRDLSAIHAWINFSTFYWCYIALINQNISSTYKICYDYRVIFSKQTCTPVKKWNSC